jgi:hypothetical protein
MDSLVSVIGVARHVADISQIPSDIHSSQARPGASKISPLPNTWGIFRKLVPTQASVVPSGGYPIGTRLSSLSYDLFRTG